ncbi:MAG: hypothetical protein ABL909_10995, partial [Sphingopyxis sp.]
MTEMLKHLLRAAFLYTALFGASSLVIAKPAVPPRGAPTAAPVAAPAPSTHVDDVAEYPDNVVIGIVPSEGSRSYPGRLIRIDRAR